MKTNKNAPADVGASRAGARSNNQVQDTPERLSSQDAKESITAVAMVIAGLRIELTEEFGEGVAYQMLIKMFQIACMGPGTIHAEGRAAEMYLREGKR